MGKDAISRWREAECKVLTDICKAHNIEIAAPEKSRGSLTVEAYKEYAQVTEKVDEKQKEVKQLDNEIGNKGLILEWRKQAVADAEDTLEKLGTELQEKHTEVEQLDEKLHDKSVALEETSAAVAENNAILEKSAEKVSAIRNVDEIQTKKTFFGDNVTVSQTDYNNLTNLAKKQIAAENRESELTAEVTKLKKENEELSSENSNLREKAQAARSLKFSLSDVQRELDNLKAKYQKVMEFIESLGLKEKLDKFLHPVTHIKKGR